MNEITIESPGLATIQDAGRTGFTEIGVSRSGAFDPLRYRAIVQLLKEDSSFPSIELLAGILRFSCADSIEVATVGASLLTANGSKLVDGSVHFITPGSTVEVRSEGAPCYIGVKGLRVDEVLGSRSYDTSAHLGPKPLEAGDKFEVSHGGGSSIGRFLNRRVAPFIQARATLPVLPGIHHPASLLADGSWTVTSIARSGVRMRSTTDFTIDGLDIASQPVVPGAIQMTPAGESIVLGPDSGTTGGYPIVGVVPTFALSFLARLRMGNTIGWKMISNEESVNQFHQISDVMASCVTDPAWM